MINVLWGSVIWVLIITDLCAHPASSKCIHDKIQESLIPKSTLNYDDQRPSNSILAGNRTKRFADDPFKALRITVWYGDVDTELTAAGKAKLKDVMKNVTKKANELFAVIPVTGNLLLTRTAPCKVWTKGLNKNKCSTLSPRYGGESCGDGFKIPDVHLEGLSLYHKDEVEPYRTVKEQGAGLNDTDFVLYVKARNTNECLTTGANVIAYGAYCQLDQFDRPVAGLINFCPGIFYADEGISERKIFTVALHELFHTLGFSKDLFKKYKDCTISDSRQNCKRRKRIVDEILGRKRLVTPSVVKQTSQHYKCHERDFGAVLQFDESNEIGSHWDAAFLQGSIMAPNIELPRLTFLDPITLAAFEDSGWYKVDFEQAHPYIFGSGMGCNFSINCNVDDGYFCTGSDTLCHYKHFHKGKCSTGPFLHGCKIYKAIHTKGSCTLPMNAPYASSEAGEMFNVQSRCYVANLTTQTQTSEMKGHCYISRCTDKGKLEVKVENGEWNPCPFGESIEIEGYSGMLQCPRKGVLCSKKKKVPTATLR